MKDFVKIASDLAKEIGLFQLSCIDKKHSIKYKDHIDFLTDIDKKCESMIVDRIKKEFPTHSIFAEEGTNEKHSSDYKWIVDPLDGTVNYTHKFPYFGVSIGLEYKKEMIAGVIYEPNRDELFVCEKASGATMNGKKISVSRSATLKESLLVTGFAYNIYDKKGARAIPIFNKMLLNCRSIRRPGAAAINLAYVACGRLDGFWELYLSPWDIAAGTIMISEAGGWVSKFDGTKFDIYDIELLATNGLIHGEMMEMLAC